MDTATKRGEQTGLLGWLHANAQEGEGHTAEHLHYDRGSRAWRRHEDLAGIAARSDEIGSDEGDTRMGSAA
jgi:hypothetical protein